MPSVERPQNIKKPFVVYRLSESQLEELKKKLTEEKELELKQQVAILLNFVCSYLTHRKISFECLSNGQRIVLVHSRTLFECCV